jgi:hypothetical protein
VEQHVSNDRYIWNVGSQTNKFNTVQWGKYWTIFLQFTACVGTGAGLMYGTYPSVIGMSIGGGCLLLGGGRCVQVCCSKDCRKELNSEVDQDNKEKTDSKETDRIVRRIHYCTTHSDSTSKTNTDVYNWKFLLSILTVVWPKEMFRIRTIWAFFLEGEVVAWWDGNPKFPYDFICQAVIA